MNSEDIAFVEKSLNYTFTNKDLLIRALTRKAFAQEKRQQGASNCEDQEVYRILGDAVLKAILVEMLIQEGYDSRESITKEKINLENRENLGNIFKKMGIAPFIRLGCGEKKQGIAGQLSVLGETFEALVAAVHLDSGSYEKTKNCVINIFRKQESAEMNKKSFSPDSKQDIISQLWMSFNVCDTCFHPDICANMRMCYFEVTGDD